MIKPLATSSTFESNRQFNLWVFVIVAVGLALRLWNLDFSYSNDELSALSRTVFSSLSDLIDKGVIVDFHPAGVQIFLYYWVKLFGMDEWVVRLPFVISGTLGIWLAILTFTRWFGRQAGLLAGAVLVFTELPLLYSQIARPYGSGLFLSMFTVYFWTLFLQKEKPSYKYALGFALSAAACLYNHHFSGLFAFIVGVAGFFMIPRTHFKLYLAAGLLTALLYLPHLPITFAQMSIGGVGEWLGKPSWKWPLEHFALLFNHSWLVLVAMLLIGVAQWKYFKPYKGARRFRIVSLIIFGAPLLIGFFYSMFVNPVLQHSILIFSAPFLFAFLFSWSFGIPQKVFNNLLIVFLIIGISQTIFFNRYYSAQHFGEFKGVAQAIADWNGQYGEDSITVAVSANNPWYLYFYLDKMESRSTEFAQADNRGGADLDSLKQILDECNTPYFLYAWTKPVPFEIRDMILARFPCIVDEVNYHGLSEATLYAKEDAGVCLTYAADTLVYHEFEDSTLYEQSELVEGTEFFPVVKVTLSDVLTQPYGKRELVVVTSVKMSNSLSGALLVASIEDENGETVFWTAAKFDLFALKNAKSKVRLTLALPDKKLFHMPMSLYVWNPKRALIQPEWILLMQE